jgi:hypothetical protein
VVVVTEVHLMKVELQVLTEKVVAVAVVHIILMMEE